MDLKVLCTILHNDLQYGQLLGLHDVTCKMGTQLQRSISKLFPSVIVNSQASLLLTGFILKVDPVDAHSQILTH